MERDEARRRFEKSIVLAGYSGSGKWVDEGQGIESQALRAGKRSLRGFRAVLWPSNKAWEGMLSFRVGEKGEFPLTGGRVTREKILVLQPLKLTLPKLIHIEPTVKRWEGSFDTDAVRLCVDQLSLELIKKGHTKKASTLIHAMSHGDLGACTIGEALSMVQERWFTSREQRLLAAKVWWRTLEPRLDLGG